MWPFKNARDKPAANSPDYGKMRNVNRTRADWTMANSEAIYAAVSRISNTIAMIPMHLYKGMEIVRDDPREIQVAYTPNATMNPFTFRQTMEAFRNVEGSAYALLVPTEDGLGVSSMDVLDAARVTPMRDQQTREIWYRFTLDDGVPAMVHSSSMIALHHMSANGERAIRPVDVLAGTLDYDRQIKEFSLTQLDGVNTGVVLNIPGATSFLKLQNVANYFISPFKSVSSGTRSRLPISLSPKGSGGNPSLSRTSFGRIHPPRIAFWYISAIVCISARIIARRSLRNA